MSKGIRHYIILLSCFLQHLHEPVHMSLHIAITRILLQHLLVFSTSEMISSEFNCVFTAILSTFLYHKYISGRPLVKAVFGFSYPSIRLWFSAKDTDTSKSLNALILVTSCLTHNHFQIMMPICLPLVLLLLLRILEGRVSLWCSQIRYL